jgi:hypothetical protein
MRFIPSIRPLLFALVVLAMSAASFAQIGISVSIAPPALPVYEQPPLPAQGLHLDAWVLGLRPGRLRLGAR